MSLTAGCNRKPGTGAASSGPAGGPGAAAHGSATLMQGEQLPPIHTVLTTTGPDAFRTAATPENNGDNEFSKIIRPSQLIAEIRKQKGGSGNPPKDIKITRVELNSLDSSSHCLLAVVDGQWITEQRTIPTRWQMLIELRGNDAAPRIVGAFEIR